MVNEFELTVVHFARPNPTSSPGVPFVMRWPVADQKDRGLWERDWPKPDADLHMRVDLPLDKKNCGKSGLGHRAAGPSRAVGCGPAFSKTREQQTHFRSSGGREVTTGNASAVRRLQY